MSHNSLSFKLRFAGNRSYCREACETIVLIFLYFQFPKGTLYVNVINNGESKLLHGKAIEKSWKDNYHWEVKLQQRGKLPEHGTSLSTAHNELVLYGSSKVCSSRTLKWNDGDFPDELWKLCFASADKPNWYRFDIKSLQRSSYPEKLDKLVPARAVCPQKTVRNLAVKRAWITVLLSLLQKGFLYKSAGSICLSSL